MANQMDIQIVKQMLVHGNLLPKTLNVTHFPILSYFYSCGLIYECSKISHLNFMHLHFLFGITNNYNSIFKPTSKKSY